MRAPNWPRESFHGTYDATSVTLTITQALALYNCLELLLLIFVTFHRWRGLYFWSLTIATIGTISYGLGLMIEYFDLAVLWVGKIFDTGGWMVMVTGQSVVLYSRLGLILANPRILRAVKWMIIIDACMFHGVTTIVDWGRYTHNPAYARGYFYIEHIQMTFFCIQEFIISGLYIWKTSKLLKVISKQGVRRVMWQLFTINVVIIALLAIQYKNLHIFEQTVKNFVYSVKLKLEFSILGKLVEIVQENKRSLANALGDIETCVENPSPTLHRTLSPRSHPDPFSLAEKTRSQHVEHREHRDDTSDDITPMSAPNGSISEPVRMRTHSQDSLGTQARRRGARESDIDYAEIVRSLS